MSKEYITKLLQQNTRLDGRASDEYRNPVTIELGVSQTAEGSALVTIGDTKVMAGVKMELSTPYSDTPDEGTLMVNAELLPLSNPDFEPGQPTTYAIELARVVDRGIRESHALDVKKLCIEPGKKSWSVIIDICTINDAGNLFDASALAALAAIKDVRLPVIEDDKVNYKEKTDETLPIVHDALSCTVLKFGNKYLVDPISDEEKSYDARLTVATTEDDKLCALQKGGNEPLTSDDIKQMVSIAVKKTNELRKHLR